MTEVDSSDKELLVFGYACKLFRDDERAAYVDGGEHLIPWMDDEVMRIDRYDVRGTVFDLKLVEVPANGYDRFEGLDKADRKTERMCDKERYRSLYFDDVNYDDIDKLMTIDNSGRLYGQVHYNYDDGERTEDKGDSTSGFDDESNDPFVPSQPLPSNLILPKTNKLNSVIEKTADFISQQGAQMEILMKMKQKDNPVFNFLSIDDPLHKYYRFVLEKIKEKALQNSTVQKKEIEKNTAPEIQTPCSSLISQMLPKVQAAPEVSESFNSDPINAKSNSLLSIIPKLEIPSLNVKYIIEKLVIQVVENGPSFENLIREKKDPRFDFLNPNHKFHSFYKGFLNMAKTQKNVTKPIEIETSKQNHLEGKSTLSKQQLERKREAALLLVNTHLATLEDKSDDPVETKRRKP